MNRTLPHRRWNPLRREWILNSPQRVTRPWQGAVEAVASESRPHYDPSCYLCPGNPRVGGQLNPQYEHVYAFTNDFPAILPPSAESAGASTPSGETDSLEWLKEDIVQGRRETGMCRVACFSPRHDLTLAEMPPNDIIRVIELWRDEYDRLKSSGEIGHVMTFENKGEQMGCSNPHPHCQIWATSHVPSIPALEIQSQQEYARRHNRPLLLEYIEWERAQGERIVLDLGSWVCLVPYWAVWPFEVMVIPTRPCGSLLELHEEEIAAWSVILSEVLIKYDNLFKVSFPYSMGLYQLPCRERPDGFQMRQSFVPPLLRSATVRKFMVGFELFAEPQRDISPESAASVLRGLSTTHYKREASLA